MRLGPKAIVASAGVAAVLVAMVGARGAAGCTLSAATAAELAAALDCAGTGQTITLAPGDYGSVRIARQRAQNLTIRSARIADPARFASLAITDSTGLRLTDLAVSGAATGPRYGVFVEGSQGIVLDRLAMTQAAGLPARRVVSAIMVRNSREVTIANATIAGFWHGVSLLDVAAVQILDNRFRRIETDGIRGGGASDLVIARNILTDFAPAEKDHPDGIQLWSTRQTTAARNIDIRDNLVFRGKGVATQGIFVRDTHQQLPFENLTITGNMVLGGRYNGITIAGVTGALVARNAVLPMPDRDSWIRIDRAQDVRLEDNRAGRFVLDGAIAEQGNRVVPARSDLSAELARWLRERGITL